MMGNFVEAPDDAEDSKSNLPARVTLIVLTVLGLLIMVSFVAYKKRYQLKNLDIRYSHY